MIFKRSLLLLISSLDTLIIEAGSSRSLVATDGGVIKLIGSVIMPVELPVSLVFLQNLQFQYAMIEDATQLTELNLLRRSQSFSLTRSMAYKMIAQIWDGFGMNGTACVLRTICEVNRLPSFKHSLLGSILASIFTPHPKTDSMYIAAAAKKPNKNCHLYHSNCMDKLSTMFSQFIKTAANK